VSGLTALHVERPIWRRFAPRFLARAIEHVRAGGLAAIVHDETRVDLVLPAEAGGALTTFAAWALASLEHAGDTEPQEGPDSGLRSASVDFDQALTILDWCDRDAVHPGPTRAMVLDCVACTACCQDADVVVETGDLARLVAHGRADLASESHYRRDDEGRLHLRFLGSRCEHLGERGACAIYEARYTACRAFPPGSEPCLAAREDTLDVRDDAPDAREARE